MSSVILDTHILLWDQLDPKRLSVKAKKALDLAETQYQIILSEITLWEISVLIKKKRLKIDIPYLEFMEHVLQTRSFLLQGINPEIAYLSNEIDIDTKDPADRIIAATSIILGLPLISADHFMHESFETRTIW